MSDLALVLCFIGGMAAFGLIAISVVLCWYLRTESRLLDREDAEA
ncbi:hypothetical protein J2Y58_002912 [Sphingomonas sp. BE138]|nr:hypothetical protein [Sphingomonas sp. BE138]MDR6789539.1 hypothetical protein [Sphingomonas sp. BE138]